MRYTDAPARRAELVSRLTSSGYVSSSQVSAELGVSEMTIRRDLRRLAEEGLAQRVPGGASLPTLSGAQTFDARRAAAGPAKRQLARAGAALLSGGALVALDAGTTVAAIVDFLPRPLRVVSHSLPVLVACTASADLDVIGLGGGYQSATRSFAGRATRSAMSELSVDVAVLSATAVTDRGLFSASEADAEIKQAMIAAAAHVVVLADQTKLGSRAPVRFARPEDVGRLLTDAPEDDPRLAVLRQRYAHVVPVTADPEQADQTAHAHEAGHAG